MNLRNTDNAALAILEKENPNIASLIQLYPPELSNILLNNKEKIAKISKSLTNVTSELSSNTIIMKCSESCIHKDICVFAKNDIAPIGYSCPIEKQMVLDLQHDLVKHLEIDKSNVIEMELLWDLIDVKLLDMRSSGALKSGSLVQIIEVTENEKTFKKEEISPNFEAKLMLKKLKHSIIDSFVATRRAKKKYGMQTGEATLEQLIRNAAENVTETG